MSTLMLTDILWLQLAPTASATIGWKYYLVFIALTAVHLVYFWFRLPEVSLPFSLFPAYDTDPAPL
jgi:hypothetical protein